MELEVERLWAKKLQAQRGLEGFKLSVDTDVKSSMP